jgi:hypothetical protein
MSRSSVRFPYKYNLNFKKHSNIMDFTFVTSNYFNFQRDLQIKNLAKTNKIQFIRGTFFSIKM